MNTLTLDQKHYFAYCALQGANTRVRELLATTDTDALAEWRGIVRACRHEVVRLARRKHFASS